MEKLESNMEEENMTAEDSVQAGTAAASPDGEEPKKQPTEEEILRRRKFIVIPVFVLAFLAVIYWILVPSEGGGQKTAGGSGFNVNVPEPTTVQLEGNKTDAYERQSAQN